MKINKKTIMNIVVIMLVSVFSLTVGATAATTISASQIVYNNTTVQAKVDELVDIANNKLPVDPDAIDLSTFQTNKAKTVYASSKGVCINRNGKLNCFKINNWDVEKEHIQEVFSDISCSVNSSGVDCDASDFDCIVDSDGYVSCFDYAGYSGCYENSDGTVDCG